LIECFGEDNSSYERIVGRSVFLGNRRAPAVQPEE
jgi:hypothetical protein